MKKAILILIFSTALTVAPTVKSHAIVWEVVRQALVAAIKAADLAIQRLQNKTIWLQNAQKSVENTFAKFKLDEITDWTNKHKDQYQKYYDELSRVRTKIKNYKKVKDIITTQLRIVSAYKRTFSLLQKDQHFSVGELQYMTRVYDGIIAESLKNIDQLYIAVQSVTGSNSQMTDGQRLGIIHQASDGIEKNLSDLQRFNTQNIRLSINRSKSLQETQLMKAYYGIQ